MLNVFERKKRSVVNEERDRIYAEMQDVNPGSDEYNTLLDRFERLTILQAARPGSRVSPDTMAIVGANLIGILVIVGYEQGHVIASRALNFLLTPKTR